MRLLDLIKKGLVLGLSAQFILATQLATEARAEMLTTESAISKYSAQADRNFLLSEIQKKDVRDAIVAQGVDPAEAEARLRALSDEEVASMVQEIDAKTAGGDGGIIGVLFTVFIILLVTDILCLTKVFGFTRCAR